MLNIIAAILVFGVIILIHEFGHFSLAKLNGIGVLEFSIGMGPVSYTHLSESGRRRSWTGRSGGCTV